MSIGSAQKLAAIALAIACNCALANPEGPQVVHGTASFAQPNANTLNVTNSHNAIINWQRFDIDRGQTTNFIQPGSNSAVLNRVLSNNPSQIYGNLNSNGKVFLINQHGLMIGAGASINTAGFYGSTLNITNEDFLKGNLSFEGGGFGGIQNHGYIHAGPNGNVVLVAPDIENGGVIEVDNGNIILAAGESIRITSLNDAAIEFDLQSPENSVINLGEIIARQGAARLFAGHLEHSGSINATGIVRNADGSISLVAQQDIRVAAGATLTADGDAGGEISVQSHHGDVYFEGAASARGRSHHGGRIEILGERVGLFGEAVVDASGKTGGGEVLVGGDFQGGGETQTARQTQVGPHAVIHADALESGDGGKVIVWSDDFTLFEGEATAKGGDGSGDGGFLEISGLGNLGYYGSVNASAPKGLAGTVLFDPIDVIFQTGVGGFTVLSSPLEFTDNPGQILTFEPSALTDITEASTNATVKANRDIRIESDLITSAGGNGGDMIFWAGQSITINANITTDNGNLLLYANVAPHAVTPVGPNAAERGTGEAKITQSDAGSVIDAGTGNVEFWMNSGVDGTAGDITVGNVNANHVLIKHNGADPNGSILPTNSGVITASSVFIDHDGPLNGLVGSPDPALNLVVDSVGAHIHEPTAAGGGIYINATANSGSDVTVGNTCYGTGTAPGCNTFGPHIVKGLETINGGGQIEFNAIGNVIIEEPIGVSDNNNSGNPGDIVIDAASDITNNAIIFNNVGQISLSATDNININADITASVPLTDINLDADSDNLGGGQINLDATLDADTGVINAPGDIMEINLGLGTVDSDMTLQDLNLVEGTLTGSGNITVTGLTTWNPATAVNTAQNFFLLGSGFLFANGGFDLGSNLDNDTLTLDKLLTVGAVINNWNDAGVSGNTITGVGTIVNNGLIQAFNDTLLDVNVIVNNNVQISKESGSGVLRFSNGLIMASGSELSILPGTVVDPGGVLLLGSATELSGGGTLDGSVNSFGGIIDIEDGSGLPSILTITGSLALDLSSTLAIDLGGLSQGVEYDLLDVGGAVTLDGTLALFWDDSFTPGYTSNIGDFFDIVRSATSIAGSFDTVIDPAGVTDSGSSAIIPGPPDVFRYVTDTVAPSIIFWNVNVSGDWDVAGNWLGGAVPISTDYVVINQDDDAIVITIQDARTIAGMESQNNITISSTGSLTMNDDLLFTGDSLVLGSSGVGLTMNGIATVAGQLDWNSGSIAGGGSIDIYQVGSLNINPGAGSLDNAIFNNTVVGSTWSGGAAAGTGQLTNRGLLEINGAGNFSSAIPLINDAGGSITKVDANTTTLTGTVTAGGSFQVDAGTLELQDPVSINANFSIASGATLSFTGGGNYTSVGTIQGSGTVDVTGASSFAHSGFIQPGGAGTTGILTLDGDLVNTGFLQIEIASNGGGSPTPGVDYDQLVVTGDIDLQSPATMSLFALGGYTVTDGDSFLPILYGSISSNTLSIVPIGTETVTPVYGPGELTITLNIAKLITWIGGGGDDFWNTAANWDLGIPTAADDAVIPLGSTFTVSIANAADANTLSLAADATITQTANTLTLANGGTLSGDYDLNGGTLSFVGSTLTLDNSTLTIAGGTLQGGALTSTGTGGVAFGAGLNTFSGVIVDTDILIGGGQTMRVTNGLSINAGRTITLLAGTSSAATLQFVNAQAISGGGSIFMDGTNSNLNFVDGGGGAAGTLTIGSGISISGSGTVGTNSAGYLTLNLGTITASSGDTIQNDLLTNGVGGQLIVDGGTMTMAFAWDNLGSMTVDNAGAFNLGGPFPSSALEGGKYVNLDGASTTTITGTMDIGGGNFTITDAGTGTGSLQMIPGGEIANGTLLQSGAATLLITPSSPFAQLNNVSLGMDLNVGNGGTLRILNDLRINVTRTLTLASTGSATTLQAFNPQSILGNGSIVLGGSSALNFIDTFSGAGTLTIGAGISISGSGTIGTNSAGFLTLNNGTITANTGDVINTDLLTNGVTGSLIATNGGSITMNFDWDNLGGAGSMAVSVGGSFTLGATGGTFPSSALAGGRYTNDGTGTTTLAGTMDLGGGGFDLTDTIGDILIQGGTILNGTITQSGAATYLIGTGFNTLDNVTVDMDLLIGSGQTLRVQNSLTINGSRTITLAANAGAATLQFVNANQLVAGTGSIFLDATNSVSNFVNHSGSAGTTTIGAGITISGGGQVGSASASYATVNDGTVTAVTGDSIILQNFSNGPNGTISAQTGGFLSYGVLTGPNTDGIVDLTSGGTLNTNNGNLNLLPSAIIRGAGTVDLGTGTLTNDGILQPGGTGTTGILTILGDLTMTSTADLQIEIDETGTTAGTDYDQLLIDGAAAVANLDGAVTVTLLAGNPAPSSIFRLVETSGGAGLVNSFAADNLPAGFLPLNTTATFVETTFQPGLIFWDDDAGDGLWNSSTNWSGDVVPTIGNDVQIDGGFNVTIAAAASANALTLNGDLTINNAALSLAGDSIVAGSLTLTTSASTADAAAQLDVSGVFTWNGGTLTGTGTTTLLSGATLDLTGTNAAMDLNAHTLVLDAGSTVNYTSTTNQLRLANGAILQNDTTFTLTQLGISAFGGISSIVNNATFAANLAAPATVTVPFTNDGLVDVQAGDLTFSGGGGSNGGMYTIAGSLTLGGTHDYTDASIGGAGTLITTGPVTLDDTGSAAYTVTNTQVASNVLSINHLAPVTLTNLTIEISSSSLSGSADRDITALFTWNGGTLTGTGTTTLLSGSTLDLAGTNAAMDLNAHTLVLDASSTVNYTSTTNQLRLANGAILQNDTTFTLTQLGISAFGGISSIVNNATFAANLAAPATVTVPFTNGGLVDVQAGDLTFSGGGGSNGGMYTIAGSLTLGGTHDYTDASIGGAGTLITTGPVTLDDTGSAAYTVTNTQVASNVLSINHLAPVTLTNLTLQTSSSSLAGSGDRSIAGLFTWAGGSLTGTGTTTLLSGATLNLAGANAAMDLNAHTLVLDAGSTVNYTSTTNQLRLANGAILQNDTTFTLTQLGIGAFGGVSSIVNNSSFAANLAAPATVTVPFTNDGLVDVQAGDLTFSGGGSSSGGTFTIAGTLTLGGTHDYTDASIGGAGTLITTGAVTLDDTGSAAYTVTNTQVATSVFSINHLAPVTLTNLTIDISSASLSGSADRDISGIFDWNGGILTGTGTTTLLSGSTLNLTGTNAAMDLIAHTLVLDAGSTVNYTSTVPQLRLANGAILQNDTTFTLTQFGIGAFGGVSSIVNNGTFTANLAASATVSVPFTNNGTLDVQAGSLTLTSPLALPGASILRGSGTIVTDVTNNGGRVQPGGPGAPGTLTIDGDFTNTTGVVEIEIQSTGVAGTDYDLLAITGQADLNDTLTLLAIGGYTVNNNDSFTPITYASRSANQFGTINSIIGETVSPTYFATSLDLLLTTAGLFIWDDGAGDGFWNSALNWSGDAVPTIGDDASIGGTFNVTIAAAASANTLSLASTATLTLNANTLTLANDSTLDGTLTVDGGTLDLNGTTLTLTSTLTWSNTATITNGTLGLPAAAQMLITGGAANTLSNVTVNVAGDVTYSGGNLTLQNGTVFNADGSFDFAGDFGIVDGGAPASTFNAGNGGIVVKSAGTAISAIDSTLTSSVNGSVAVQTGTLDLNIGTLNLGPGDVFSGNGTLLGNVTNNGGVIRPGGAGARGTLTITGTYINTTGTLEIEIDGAATHDVFAVTTAADYSAADPASVLDISYIGGYVPSVGENHDVITCLSTCDTVSSFGTVNEPVGITHLVDYSDPAFLRLTVLSASFLWSGGGDGVNWFDPNNWSLIMLPDSGSDVVLASGDNVTFDGGLATIASLTLDIGSSLNIASGTLTNAGLLTVNGGATLSISGGELDNGGNANFGGIFAMSSGIATFRGNSVFNGSYSHTGGAATFTGSAAFNGPNTHAGGTTTFNNTSSFGGNTLISGGTRTFNGVGTLFGTNNTWTGGTITGAASLQLGAVLDGSTLSISGANNKFLTGITLDMNQNDIFMSGSGNLVLAGGAVIDNTGGTSFNHGGNGGITGNGTFDNTGGRFNKLSGNAVIAPTVNFINTPLSLVNVAGGSLTFGAGGADAGNYSVAAGGALLFPNGRTLAAGGTLNLAGSLVVGNGTPSPVLTLPGTLNNTGNITLNNATLDLSNLGNTLNLNNGASLGGTGNVAGTVNNNSGVLVVGGAGNLGNLAISGNYNQGSASALVVDVFNNGFTTVSDQLAVGGATTLNGVMVVGFTTNSLGLVTANFQPFTFGSVSGNFTRVIDAAGNILLIDFSGGVFTILGTAPRIPDRVIEDLIAFAQKSEELARRIADNRSEAEAIMEALLEEEQESGSLICN